MCMSRGPETGGSLHARAGENMTLGQFFLFLTMTHKCVHAFNLHKSVDTSYTYAKSVNNKKQNKKTKQKTPPPQNNNNKKKSAEG